MLQTVVRPLSVPRKEVTRAAAAELPPDVAGLLPELQGEALGKPAATKNTVALQVVTASAMATSEARLGFTSILLLMLAGLRLTLQLWQKRSRPFSATLPASEPTGEEQRHEAQEAQELAVEELAEPTVLLPPPLPPPPRPRLQVVGAKFTVGDTLLTGSRGPTLSVDLPSTPACWPLRAVLSRPDEDGPWTSLELTVDIPAACELPPLIACSLVSCLPHTGGTPFRCFDTRQPQVSPADSMGGTGAPEVAADGSPWFFMHNGGGCLLASISRTGSGCEVRHQNGLFWEVELHDVEADDDEPWLVVSRLGQPIGQASRFQRQGETTLRLETLPEAKSPDSALLLTCMLAVATLRA